MHYGQNRWAIVLAAGEGNRLRSLTTDESGESIPKQFCSLRGGESLLNQTIRRAQAVTRRENICVVVSGRHRRWWQPMLADLPHDNAIAQSCNRGTANGILLPLLHILSRQADAQVVILPSDHYVHDEPILVAAIQKAMRATDSTRKQVLLLGIEPELADCELGYILPGNAGTDFARVLRFVEKPELSVAQSLLRQGAVWNSFILAGRASAFVNLIYERHPDLVSGMRAALLEDKHSAVHGVSMARYYRDLRPVDFSSQVLEGAEQHLRVLCVKACGWSDLGTPKRVADTLRRLEPLAGGADPHARRLQRAPLDLAVQHAAFGGLPASCARTECPS